jgi:hypothetical protein
MENVGNGKLAMNARKNPPRKQETHFGNTRNRRASKRKILKFVIKVKEIMNKRQRIYKREVPVEEGKV